MARRNLREPGDDELIERIVTRKVGGRPVKPIRYEGADDLPHTPQAEIDVCLECPLPDCRPWGCPLKQGQK